MLINHRLENQVCVLEVVGDIALGQVDGVKQYASKFVEDSSVQALVIDLKQVKFIDSRGLGLLMWLMNALRKRQAKFALCGVGERIKPLLRMTQLDTLVPIYASDTEALAGLQAS